VNQFIALKAAIKSDATLFLLSLKSESPSFQPLITNMQHSAIQLLTKAGLSAFLLATAQAASALTITYTANSATYVPNGVPLTGNTRPVQLSPGGNAMNTGAIPNTRNFIYQSLVGNYAPAGNWMPFGQSLSAGEQRFDYNFLAATSSGTGGTSGSAAVHDWNNKLNLDFGSFFLTGGCSFCGSGNAVSLINSTNTGTAKFIGEAPSSTAGNSILGNQNTITSSIYPIVFGASGITGTLQYTAFTDVTSGLSLSQSSGGTITLNVNAPTPPTSAVPGPLPVLGAGAAFGFSRRLRRRILDQANRIQSI
jgi:hypothetical protein